MFFLLPNHKFWMSDYGKQNKLFSINHFGPVLILFDFIILVFRNESVEPVIIYLFQYEQKHFI